MSPSKLFLYASLLLLTQCSKCKQDDPSPESQLPPATQTGANTFGCLLNGQAWTPQGYDGLRNFSVSYDPTYRQGTLSVAAYRYENSESKSRAIGIFSDSVLAVGRYPLRTGGRHGAAFVDSAINCEYDSGKPTTYCRGELEITRLDVSAGIIAGVFSFTLATPGCDTLRVTKGRFDYKL